MPKIYTKTGDAGQTSHIDGSRISKSDPLIEAIGIIDESNASIGLARSLNPPPLYDNILEKIQKKLFIAGADAMNQTSNARFKKIETSDILQLEQWIDQLDQSLEPLTQFILPTGTPFVAHLHFSRTLIRKAERQLVALHPAISHTLQTYFNRLSDLLFILARHAQEKNNPNPSKPR